MVEAALAGFALGLSLIVAIGAQNAFVLRQGIRREHVLPVVLACAVSDAVLIAAGVAGVGALVAAAPALATAVRWAGAAFLLGYAALALRRAWRGGEALEAGGRSAGSARRAVGVCLALTWLNPHVYLDTVLLIGSLSTGFPGREAAFGAGAVAASFAFFFALGYGARLLRPVFARPEAWQVFELMVAAVMVVIALGLIAGA